MNLAVVLSLLGLVACAWCRPGTHGNFTFPLCDSPEAEAAAQVALDFINAQHTHGYKYTLNQVEDIKVINKADGTHAYLLELEFLETKCHVSNPKPVAQCDVRQKFETAVEADCDVALSDHGGKLSVIAFKCKTELERPDFCAGCINLQPLNITEGQELVRASLERFNKNHTHGAAFAVLDVGRVSSQVVGGGADLFRAEYAIIETNCTSVDDDHCVPQTHANAIRRHGFCLSVGFQAGVEVDCEIFPADNATLPAGPGSPSTTQGFKNHKLTALHDPGATGLVSAESESAEKAPVVKREAVDAPPPLLLVPQIAESTVLQPRCPGKIIHF